LGRAAEQCGVMKKLLRASLTLAAMSAANVGVMSPVQAQCPAHNCRYFFQPTVRNQWGYGGLVQTWGLGGPAMAPLNGGAIVGVTPYGPNPYDHVKPNGW
jgi:hypothetical protein